MAWTTRLILLKREIWAVVPEAFMNLYQFIAATFFSSVRDSGKLLVN